MAKGFAKGFDDFRLQFIDGSERTVRATTIKLWSTVIKSSPVLSGRFRGNWQASDASAATGIVSSTDRSGSDTISKATKQVLNQSDWSVFTLTNNLPYGPVIEFGGYNDGPNTEDGYSKQAPYGVIRVNVARFNSILQAEARKNLPK